MNEKVKLSGITLNKSQKFTESEITYAQTNDTEVAGFGRYITKDVAKIIIKSYREHLKKSKDEKQPFGVTFGKEALLSILAQKDCEGIRFYFGKRDKSHWEANSKYAKLDNITLVAVGVDDKNKDLGTNGSYIIEENNKQKSAVKSVTSESENTKIVEVVPPEP